ncbi:hypothetical protein Q8A67_014264 [Cirrhinus molitorella]|uniref:Uncharacterized protein n=1 Tax=Cirrhinus molitorella TaxID=172907 RepID=A0AA88PNC6_9TELE|nr:hypothetical protein Q8A67_014264 [Cirrhinus molitorella]
MLELEPSSLDCTWEQEPSLSRTWNQVPTKEGEGAGRHINPQTVLQSSTVSDSLSAMVQWAELLSAIMLSVTCFLEVGIVVSSRTWSDITNSIGSVAILSSVAPYSDGSLEAAGWASPSSVGLGLVSAQHEDGGLGSRSGCAPERGRTISKHRIISSLQLSPEVSGQLIGPNPDQTKPREPEKELGGGSACGESCSCSTVHTHMLTLDTCKHITPSAMGQASCYGNQAPPPQGVDRLFKLWGSLYTALPIAPEREGETERERKE